MLGVAGADLVGVGLADARDLAEIWPSSRCAGLGLEFGRRQRAKDTEPSTATRGLYDVSTCPVLSELRAA